MCVSRLHIFSCSRLVGALIVLNTCGFPRLLLLIGRIIGGPWPVQRHRGCSVVRGLHRNDNALPKKTITDLEPRRSQIALNLIVILAATAACVAVDGANDTQTSGNSGARDIAAATAGGWRHVEATDAGNIALLGHDGVETIAPGSSARFAGTKFRNAATRAVIRDGKVYFVK